MSTHIYTWMFIAALFIIAKSCPSVDEWISELWYIQTLKYLMLKRNDLSSYETTEET